MGSAGQGLAAPAAGGYQGTGGAGQQVWVMEFSSLAVHGFKRKGHEVPLGEWAVRRLRPGEFKIVLGTQVFKVAQNGGITAPYRNND